MITTLVAALSLASSLAIDVPYLPQTDALCGGAAAAMVFRYWGDAHADAQDFASLVDRRAGGIANGALAGAVAARGWRAGRIEGSIDALEARVHDGQPVIVLLPDRGDRYHYVVVIGATADAIVVHDPTWGPSRTIRAPEFERAWMAAGFWSLLILPPERRTDLPLHTPPALQAAGAAADACDDRLTRALADIRARGFDHADARLGGVRAQCPRAAGPLRELSGVRFAQYRWSEAAALARAALDRDPHDAYALDVLGSSLFMQDDGVGALRAWNQIGKPRVNRVRIEGLHHTRYQTVAEVLAIQPNMLLTAALFDRARRRLSEMPDHARARLAVRPESDGFATVDVVVDEISAVPHGAVEWVGAAARTAADREVSVSVPGVTGQGEVWSGSWRWWNHRPGVSAAFAAPRVRGLPGVWRVEGAWQSDTYSGDPRPVSPLVVESRTHGALTVSDWLTGRVRYAVTTGFDAWNASRKAASIGGTVEHRLFDDRLSLSVDGTQWWPVTNSSAFTSVGARAAVRSSNELRGWVTRGAIGVERVSDEAPLGLWPGAGEGHARASLLRAHPLLEDGIVGLTGSTAFGRTLTFGGAEAQRWLERPALVRLALAGFADVARASRQATSGRAPVHVDLGAGLRVRIPGSPGVLRIDVAHGLRDGANALTFGWLF